MKLCWKFLDQSSTEKYVTLNGRCHIMGIIFKGAVFMLYHLIIREDRAYFCQLYISELINGKSMDGNKAKASGFFKTIDIFP
jgi:hypothetical protein